MAVRRPLVLSFSGRLEELPPGDGVGFHLRALANPALADVEDGELAADAASGHLVLRLGNLLHRFAPMGAQSYPGQADFSAARNSHWLGVMA